MHVDVHVADVCTVSLGRIAIDNCISLRPHLPALCDTSIRVTPKKHVPGGTQLVRMALHSTVGHAPRGVYGLGGNLYACTTQAASMLRAATSSNNVHLAHRRRGSKPKRICHCSRVCGVLRKVTVGAWCRAYVRWMRMNVLTARHLPGSNGKP